MIGNWYFSHQDFGFYRVESTSIEYNDGSGTIDDDPNVDIGTEWIKCLMFSRSGKHRTVEIPKHHFNKEILIFTLAFSSSSFISS